MKTKLLRISIAALSLGLSSCEKFLEEQNKSGLTEDAFYGTEQGMISVVNASYSGLRTWYGKEFPLAMTETGTDLFLRGGDNKANQLSDYTVDLNGGQTNITDAWNNLYRSLNVCNTALAGLPQSPLDDAAKAQYEGEVRFLRAQYLFLIVETWGDVVLNTEPTQGIVTTATRSAVDDFYNVIFGDLDVAIANLNPAKSTDGRITQDVAKAFKARACLTRASATNDASLYSEAAALAKELIASGRYQLFDDYKAMWDMANADGGGNSEVLYYVNYTNDDLLNGDFDAVGGRGNNNHLHFIMVYDREVGMERTIGYGRPFQRYMPSVHLLDLYNEGIDQRYHGSFQTVWLATKSGMVPGESPIYPEMGFGDTAIVTLKTVATPAQVERARNRYRLIDRNNMYRADGTPALRSQFIQLSKFMDPTRLTVAQEWSSRDVFVIRLAELYLIVAEAELNTNPGEALEYINELRSTRAIPGKEIDMEITAAELSLDFILEERARELAGEFTRWYDLKRTGKLVEYVQTYNPDGKSNIKDFHTVRPIPQTQLDAIMNKDEFKQNPGYN
ncbi:RagB/SusD family nutrient uptake outer membrane protein [Parapedobacter sp. DT-150]|uniref:RagB/SusD family nutrient uptake outer membrane protein n=1 Tax=Parapedobacter sp. DT-150 TaxID=3396162 RepID=UPI003F1A9394